MDNNLSSHTKKYNTDDVIFLEYERGDKFYLVQSGSVKITKVIKDVEKLLDIVYPGEFFGEMAILEDTTRSASAIANEPTVLLELRKENFQNILANNTVMALKLSKTFAKRIFDAKRRLLILQLNETDLRVYDCLLLLAELQNIPRDHYYEPQELNATINDIANWCGVKVVEVQKVLNTLVKTGKIDIRTNTIYVKNLKEIQRQIDLKRKKS
ncbi:Crp/Fnr family transcriptional regulator [Brachyspira hampsonii]|uniref:cAMP-dependent protein kinase regulatory chain n=1 Tax=Brachyspira hampsonii 30446 TaxID=1289135 RepID=A0A2U4EUJ7_9SPIR|nr:Crp/Fnr family transcriptional regulator [Brachyspira hampsonii]EKV56338.1 cAMP-dependent protein kinase regulatory chain [Brachyspira hampsonii 30446]MBW5390083.1 Crp/Fnr family transcriptional regulator [Brachyspira hampsonii]MBW5395428.1 Crp/Fnr family transcriptional regulator [Brachyspira hampsonii]OEJ16604.1 calcium-binding protein [Brachyspira hampsonii]PTY40480.1 calcium-binding protein [Brachyspira hampsonii bv. II]